ncbi:MAG: M48 family metalloprotease [Flavobacterium lindanitolerans]|uniref:M56 family metallopeptidase n=1 Tax=Flavobacterium lindanitolerans TaxID=428988 RepID=UPI001A3EEBEC|nr:M56 family metallopeptidase [Flavobacterium lindanitolerans]MBL7868123.1 M48 family metalloprotease [Flavobacterium lindanitolerans]
MIMPNENILKAISWTLIHSVWQGLVLAILAGLVIVFTRKSKAAIRYNVLSGLFVMFLIAVGFTFNYEYHQEIAIEPDAIMIAGTNPELQNTFTGPSAIAPDYFEESISYLNQYATTIVVVWFLIFAIKCFGIFRNLTHVYRIRNYKVHNAPELWSSKVADLSKKLGISKPIVLLESQLVKVPSVTGFFKPIILVPVGLLSQLPQDQIEAILLHELAHIRRKDYFINLLQSFAEILFFFNPGVLWISSLIKDERENCCDDIAVTITQSKSKFIHALVSFQEYNMKQNELALGFGKNKNQLLARAKRIIQDNNKSLNTVEKTFLSVCIIIMLTFSLACSNTKATTAKTAEKENKVEIAYLKGLTRAKLSEGEEIRQAEIAAQEAQKAAEIAKVEAEAAKVKAETAKAEAQKAQQQGTLSDDEAKQYEAEASQAQVEFEKAKKEHDKAMKKHKIAMKEHEKVQKEDKKVWKEHEKAMKKHKKAMEEHEKAMIQAEKDRKSVGTTYQIVRPMTFEEAQKSGICVITDKIKADNALVKKLKENDELLVIKMKEKDKLLVEKMVQADALKEKRDLWLIDQKAKFRLKKAEMIEIKKIKQLDLQKIKFSKDSLLKVYKENWGQKTGSTDVPNSINGQIIPFVIKEKAIANLNNPSYKLNSDNIIFYGEAVIGNTYTKPTKYLKPNSSALYYNFDSANQNLKDAVKPVKS